MRVRKIGRALFIRVQRRERSLSLASRRLRPPRAGHRLACPAGAWLRRSSPHKSEAVHFLPGYKKIRRADDFFVPGRGLEPPCIATYAPEAYASTNFATRAFYEYQGTVSVSVSGTDLSPVWGCTPDRNVLGCHLRLIYEPPLIHKHTKSRQKMLPFLTKPLTKTLVIRIKIFLSAFIQSCQIRFIGHFFGRYIYV